MTPTDTIIALEKALEAQPLTMVGGKDKTRIRNATPPEFRQVLIDIANLACKD